MVEESTMLNETEVKDASREAAEKTFVKIFLEAAKRSQPVTTRRIAKPWWTEEVAISRKLLLQAENQLKDQSNEKIKKDQGSYYSIRETVEKN